MKSGKNCVQKKYIFEQNHKRFDRSLRDSNQLQRRTPPPPPRDSNGNFPFLVFYLLRSGAYVESIEFTTSRGGGGDYCIQKYLAKEKKTFFEKLFMMQIKDYLVFML